MSIKLSAKEMELVRVHPASTKRWSGARDSHVLEDSDSIGNNQGLG